MRFTHGAHPGKALRLGYCLNVHPAATLQAVVSGIETITLPLRERLAPGSPFGVGMYLPARAFGVPSDFADGGLDSRAAARQALTALGPLFERHALDAFTFNAFPFGDFHSPTLKARVFEPTWLEPSRARWTGAVAALAAGLPRPAGRSHISISTHTGMHSSSPQVLGAGPALASALTSVVRELGGFDSERIVLALEPEPRANCNDTGELRALFAESLVKAGPKADLRAHLGTCLDACHAAVEFEVADEALSNAAAGGAGIAKLQITNAVRLRDPARNHRGRAALFAMAEPRYLHQVTGRGPAGRIRAHDLPEVQRAFAAGDPAWAACDEWRCHFHVPVDLAVLGDSGLETTREETDRLLDLALTQPALWGPDELHLEIETYTWDVLPTPARGSGELIDSLEREYRHVLARLARAGWALDSASAR